MSTWEVVADDFTGLLSKIDWLNVWMLSASVQLVTALGDTVAAEIFPLPESQPWLCNFDGTMKPIK